ncbi:transport membrane protein related protein [Thermoplasma acidophilum]|uniref:Transport membrane protein related protein n=2 Tax=Thermoplasma acidophilum TaxID=2303 RepID=Q9HKZ8_THEAC|nr:transport membrane protein related protein [Thermoplasma acidophilum]
MRFSDYDEVRSFLDEARWNRTHTVMALTMISGFFVWGLLLVTAPLVTEWPFVSPAEDIYVLVSSPAGLLAGNMILGYLSDRIGRKKLFIATISSGIAGIIGIILSGNFIEILLSIFLAEFGFGGEETVSLAFLAEQFPIKYRGKVLVMVSNSANVGVAAISAVFLVAGYSIFIEKVVFLAMSLAGVIIAIVTRLKLPESLRWSFVSAHSDKIPVQRFGSPIPMAVLVLFAITIVLTFALVADILGPYEYPRYTSLIPFIYGLGEAAFGYLILVFIDRIGRRIMSVMAYAGGTVSMAVFLLYIYFRLPFDIFVVLLVINAFFGELGWAVREILQPELFVTRYRGLGIATVRGIAYLLYIVSIFALSGISVYNYMIFATAAWAVGFIGSILWYTKGYETLNTSIT